MGVPDFVRCDYDQNGVVPGDYQTKSLGREHANYVIGKDGFLLKEGNYSFHTGPLDFRDDQNRLVGFDFCDGSVVGVLIREGEQDVCKEGECCGCHSQKIADFDPTLTNITREPIDVINHPPHYTGVKCATWAEGEVYLADIECIDMIEALGFGYHLGNVFKYIWRAGRKGDALEDLKKAKWYLEREIERLEADGDDA